MQVSDFLLDLNFFAFLFQDTAKSLIEDDTFYTMSVLKKEASHGYAPRSLLCCICNCLLTKNSSSFQIRVFNCGHATHIQCELLENESSSKSNLSGCPLCMPKKNTQRSRNKTVLAESGLVSKFSSRPQQSLGTTLHSHESDTSDYSNGIQQLSRVNVTYFLICFCLLIFPVIDS